MAQLSGDRVLVFLHGHDDAPTTYAPLLDAALAGTTTRPALPAAPLALDGDTRTWFTTSEEGEPIPEEVTVALATVEAAVRSAADDHGVERDRVIIGGFSQGAGLALTWLLREGPRPPGIAGVVCLAGWIPDVDGITIDVSRAAGVPVLVGHGTDDEVVPHPLGRGAARLLLRGGATVDLVEREVGHDALAFVDDLHDWIVALEQGRPLSRPPS